MKKKIVFFIALLQRQLGVETQGWKSSLSRRQALTVPALHMLRLLMKWPHIKPLHPFNREQAMYCCGFTYVM